VHHNWRLVGFSQGRRCWAAKRSAKSPKSLAIQGDGKSVPSGDGKMRLGGPEGQTTSRPQAPVEHTPETTIRRSSPGGSLQGRLLRTPRLVLGGTKHRQWSQQNNPQDCDNNPFHDRLFRRLHLCYRVRSTNERRLCRRTEGVQSHRCTSGPTCSCKTFHNEVPT
jgi:hypothetical protein